MSTLTSLSTHEGRTGGLPHVSFARRCSDRALLSPGPPSARRHQPPRIVNISVLPGPGHAFHALHEGHRPPSPEVRPALGNGSTPPRSPGHDHGHQVTATGCPRWPGLAATCTASNSHRRSSVCVSFSGLWGLGDCPPAGALGLKALLLLRVLGVRTLPICARWVRPWARMGAEGKWGLLQADHLA